MKRNKTIKIERLKEMINEKLKADISKDQKIALSFLLEEVLHETGNYNGYNYLYWIEKGHEEWLKAGGNKHEEKYLYGDGHEFNRRYY